MKDELWRAPIGSNPLIRWLKQRKMEAVMARKVARIAIETGGELPSSKSKLPGDAAALRGIPIQGKGIGGAMRDTKPEDALLMKEKRRADKLA